MIKFNNVDFTYQNAQNGAGVHNITLSIPQGQVVLLCGSSGCGKTTLTRMINERRCHCLWYVDRRQ